MLKMGKYTKVDGKFVHVSDIASKKAKAFELVMFIIMILICYVLAWASRI